MGTLTPRTYIWAHRGASAYAPENTLEAMKLAVEMGADGVELDVHFSKDRQIVVLHDAKIDRTSNGQGPVSDYTLEELKNFDFGCKFYGERRGILIPTLEEVYNLLRPYGLTVNVEIKSTDPAISKACDDVAKKCKMEDKVIYSSFDHLQLLRVKEVNPDAEIAPLYGFNMVNPWAYAENMGAFAVHPAHQQLVLFEGYADKCHSKNIRVHAWTVNEQSDIEKYSALGCDAVITNYPDIAVKVLKK